MLNKKKFTINRKNFENIYIILQSFYKINKKFNLFVFNNMRDINRYLFKLSNLNQYLNNQFFKIGMLFIDDKSLRFKEKTNQLFKKEFHYSNIILKHYLNKDQGYFYSSLNKFNSFLLFKKNEYISINLENKAFFFFTKKHNFYYKKLLAKNLVEQKFLNFLEII
jgi:hypothetical protein